MTGLNLPTGENIEILGSCINCTGSASLIATFVLILAGYAFASHFERRKAAQVAATAKLTCAAPH